VSPSLENADVKGRGGPQGLPRTTLPTPRRVKATSTQRPRLVAIRDRTQASVVRACRTARAGALDWLLRPRWRVRWKRGSRRSAPHRLCIRFGVADTSCYLGTRRPVDSRPLPVAPLYLGSPWRSAAECFRASSLGFDLARCRHDPPRIGHCAHRLGLARRTNRTRPPRR
jgi:hypothetical protein